MKCKVCGGTGTSNTCVNGTFKPCTFCDGTGEYEPFDLDVELDKLYLTKQSNEEWFNNLSTEEKAEFLHSIVIRSIQATWDGKKPDYPAYLSDWRQWLKEEHKDA